MAQQPEGQLQVVGYAESGTTPARALDASRAALTTVGVDGVNVTPDGAHLTRVSSAALALLRDARRRKERAELLVGNFDEGLGDFSPAIGDALLGSTEHIQSIASALASDVRAGGWDGITLDLESLTASHPRGLTRLVTELKQRLGAGRSVSICLMADTGNYADLGYDLSALGHAADHVVLMAYDQHGPTWSKSGPVGGTPWVRRSLAPLVRAVPRSKIQLGIAGYGYTWPRAGTGEQLSDAAARGAARHDGTKPIWDARQQEWHATLSTGTTLWWSDARTFRARLAYARSQHLGGVAVWSLGLSDPLATG